MHCSSWVGFRETTKLGWTLGDTVTAENPAQTSVWPLEHRKPMHPRAPENGGQKRGRGFSVHFDVMRYENWIRSIHVIYIMRRSCSFLENNIKLCAGSLLNGCRYATQGLCACLFP